MTQPATKLEPAVATENEHVLSSKPDSPWRNALKKFLRNPLAITGLVIMLALILLAVFAKQIAPFDPAKIDLLNANKPAGNGHLLGTDNIGRDVFSRLLYGSRVSLLVGFAVAAGSVLIGSAYGAIAGYFGGWVDTVLMRFLDLMLSFPALFLIILVQAVFGGGFHLLILIMSFTGWMGIARIVRGQFLQLREMQYVEAARAIGTPRYQIMFNHLLRNATGPIIVAATLRVGGAMLGEAGLSFIGLGVQPPATSWGQMLSNSQEYILVRPELAVWPGLCIFVAVLAVNWIGDGLRDALDPRQKIQIPKGRIAEWRANYLKSRT
jgi:peptide/nickel transport system permease protein